MKLSAVTAALLLLAACGATPEPAAPENPGIAACREEARAAGASRDFARQSVPNNQSNQFRLDQERAVAERAALSDCLRRRGLSRGGGVEPVRRPGTL
jgi:hypothetical protein